MLSDIAEQPASEWRKYYPVVAAAAAGMSLSGVAVYSVGTIIVPLSSELGWSRAFISSGPLVSSCMHVCLAVATGFMIDRIGARSVAIASVTLFCASMALLSTVGDTPLRWWALWAMIGVAGSAVPNVWTAPMGRLFKKNRGFAIAIVLSGSGIGATLVPPITGIAVASYGWREAYLILAGAWLVVALPPVLLFFRIPAVPPGPVQPVPDPAVYTQAGLSAHQGFRSPVFYRIALPTLAGALVSSTLILNLVPIFNSSDIPLTVAASIAGTIGLASMSGRIVGGFLLDRLDARLVAALTSLAGMIPIVAILVFPGSIVAATIATILFGILNGPKLAAVIYLATQHFDQRSFGVMFGTIQALLGLGSGLGPFIANFVYDETGTYDPFLLAGPPILMLCAHSYFTLPHKIKR